MNYSMDLSGVWSFHMDTELKERPVDYKDDIVLPGTTSEAKKGFVNTARETSFLTDSYAFAGYAWFERKISISKDMALLPAFLVLERTRKTTLYLDSVEIGSYISLSTPHTYDLSGKLTADEHTITILVDNTDYPTKGGHLTSPDTQTNWNGITGEIKLVFYPEIYLSDLRVDTDISVPSVTLNGKLNGIENALVTVSVLLDITEDETDTEHLPEKTFTVQEEFSITYPLPEGTLLWSEYTPVLHQLLISTGDDRHAISFGLREFKAQGDKFSINGVKTFLRGKHDGLIFPLTGAAPTSVEEWIRVMNISKSYGINHYRFHTCCPPESAFTAADLLGIYMEPELPFWGTLAAPGEEGYFEDEQNFLILEGERIMKQFGNHPSFTMFSLGNELWGSKERMAEIIRHYKQMDTRHLYTQGSNNFQWTPVILPEDDFFCGVRFSKDRQIRASYAMCDAPLGHVQTAEPSTMIHYDDAIIPPDSAYLSDTGQCPDKSDCYVEIQYETGVKQVKAENIQEYLIPQIPVISHEIGQYETFVNFKEIDKYTGSLKARNFEVFKERMEAKGLLPLAESYFINSGKLAMDCYREELESVFRSRRMAGFQILDIQDFSGQGTALVGVLDAFMDSKGLISPEEWRNFCSDAVLLARFPKYQYCSGESFRSHIELVYYRPEGLTGSKLNISLGDKTLVVSLPDFNGNYVDICDIALDLPAVSHMTELHFDLSIENTDIGNSYSIWVYPKDGSTYLSASCISTSFSDAMERLSSGESVLYLPKEAEIKSSLPGFYCSDFWCYPMFRSISEWMKKEIPVGTMGLVIHNRHKSLKHFSSKTYSTKPWWNLIQNSRAIILDELPKSYFPIVQTIDNFERNHKLGTLFECKTAKGKLLVCTIDFSKIMEKPEAKQLLSSLTGYVSSEDFSPKDTLTMEELEKVFMRL